MNFANQRYLSTSVLHYQRYLFHEWIAIPEVPVPQVYSTTRYTSSTSGLQYQRYLFHEFIAIPDVPDPRVYAIPEVPKQSDPEPDEGPEINKNVIRQNWTHPSQYAGQTSTSGTY